MGKNGGVFRVSDGLQKEFRGRSPSLIHRLPNPESAVWQSVLPAKDSVRLLKSKLSVLSLKPWIRFVYKLPACVTGPAANFNCPIVFRAPLGGGVKRPELRNTLEGLLTQTPGLKVVMPSNPYDAKGLMISAIRDNDPVFFLEHLKLYFSQKADVPEGEYTVPIGKANVVREGSDVTVITYGAMVHTSLKAAEQLEKERGTKVEVIDLRTLSPLDTETIIQSVEKTGRAVVVQEAQRSSGIAAEVIAQINEHAI